MEITDIRIKRTASEGKLMAYVTVTFGGCFVVHNIKIIEGHNGPFVAMPSRRTGTGQYKDIAHPINSEFRTLLQDRILEQYRRTREAAPDDAPPALDQPAPALDDGPPTPLGEQAD